MIFAENMPILDYHCHINPQEIYEDRKFDTITQVWLGGDHYKWRQMRSNGVDEKYVTGDSTDRGSSRPGQRPCQSSSATRCTTGATWS